MDISKLPSYPGEGDVAESTNRRREFTALDGQIETAVEVLLANPNAEQAEVLGALENRGLPPREAWRLFQFVPIAFARVVLRDCGIEFQDGYEVMNQETNVRTHHWLRDEPLYMAAVRSADRWVARGFMLNELFPIVSWSAEWDLIRQFRKPMGDLTGVWLTELLLIDFPGGSAT